MADMAMDSSVAPSGMLTPMEMQVQQQAIDRQRKIAEYLQQQSLTPEQGQMVSGHYVAPSPMQYIAKLAQGLMGTNRQSALDQQQMGLATQQGNMIRGQFGIGSQPPAAPQSPDQAPSATPEQSAIQTGLAAGAAAGSVGPTNDNLARVAAALQNQPAPLAQPSQPAQQPAPSASLVIPGMNPMVAMQQYFTDPKGYNESYRKQFDQTDLQKTMIAAGVDPRSPQGQQMLRDNIAKTNYIAPLNARPGSIIRDPKTNMPIAFNPHIPEGAAPTFDASGNVAGMNAIPGALPLMQASSKATAAGKAAVTPQAGFDANGNPVFTNQLDAAQGGSQVAPTTGAPGAPSPDGRYPAPAGGVIRPGLTPAAQAAGSEAGKGAGELWTADSNAANGYATRMFTLNKALAGLQGSDTGPGSDSVNGIKSFLLAQTPGGLGKYLPGVDPSKIASYDEANKYLMQYAIGQAGALGQGTDGKLAATLSGNANTHISNLAAQDVVKANMGLERMRQAQVQQFNQTNLPPDQYPKWTAQWNKQINPNVFIWDNLDQAKRTAAAQGMSPQQKQAFTAQYNWALQNKFIDGPK